MGHRIRLIERLPMTVTEFQRHIEKIYFTRDSERGLSGTFMWFVEEVGELATALREGTDQEIREEIADVFAWLSTLASIKGIEMDEAIQKYATGCPACEAVPCQCGAKE